MPGPRTNSRQDKNVRLDSQEVKEAIVNYVYGMVEVGQYRYKFLKTLEDLRELKETEHYVSPNFSGKNCLAVFVKLEDNYYSVYIDKRSLKYQRSTIDFSNLRLYPLKIRASRKIYNGTILDGKVINMSEFMITDAYYLEGRNLINEFMDHKMDRLSRYVKSNIREDEGQMKMSVNQLFRYSELRSMVFNEMPQMKYQSFGIIFFPRKSGTVVIFNNLERPDELYANFQMEKTKQTDVYQLFLLDDDGSTRVKKGIAYVPTMECSQACYAMFEGTHKKWLIVRCKYCPQWQKWMPMEVCQGLTRPEKKSVVIRKLDLIKSPVGGNTRSLPQVAAEE